MRHHEYTVRGLTHTVVLVVRMLRRRVTRHSLFIMACYPAPQKNVTIKWWASCVKSWGVNSPLRVTNNFVAAATDTPSERSPTDILFLTVTKLMGRWIAALPSRPVHNTVQYSSLPELNESYDCTLSFSPVPYPLWWRVVQPFP